MKPKYPTELYCPRLDKYNIPLSNSGMFDEQKQKKFKSLEELNAIKETCLSCDLEECVYMRG